MRKVREFIWSAAGCVVFMMVGFICWYVLCGVAGLDHPYLIIALVNFIGYMGHCITSLLIRRFVSKRTPERNCC